MNELISKDEVLKLIDETHIRNGRDFSHLKNLGTAVHNLPVHTPLTKEAVLEVVNNNINSYDNIGSTGRLIQEIQALPASPSLEDMLARLPSSISDNTLRIFYAGKWYVAYINPAINNRKLAIEFAPTLTEAVGKMLAWLEDNKLI